MKGLESVYKIEWLQIIQNTAPGLLSHPETNQLLHACVCSVVSDSL